MHSKVEQEIRNLAKSFYWQTLYNSAKEIGSIKLFKNDGDYTGLQIMFLHWLRLYNTLYTDLANKEDFIHEDVINDMLRTDAYLLYRRKKQERQLQKYREIKEMNYTKNNKDTEQHEIIFRREY